MAKRITILGIGLFVFFATIQAQTWTQIGSDINGEAADYRCGWSVSLSSDGSIVAIGYPGNGYDGTFSGRVRVFRNNNGVWTQMGADIDGEAVNDQFGTSVSLSSDGLTLAVGAPNNDGTDEDAGHVRVFHYDNGTWTQIGSDIDGEAKWDYSGRAVSLNSDGSIVAIGANGNSGNGTGSGHVRVYQNNNGVWTQIGSDIDGEAANDYSGTSVSLNADGSIVAIGANGNGGNGDNSGHVRVFQNVNGVWTQIGSDIDGEAADDFSGSSVSLNADGSIVAIGAPNNDGNGKDAGQVRVYQNNNGTWTQIGSDIDGEAAYDYLGKSVSLNSDGSIVAVGAPYNDGNGDGSGHVRVYRNVNGTWTQIGSDIDGEAEGDQSGTSVSISSDGSIVAIGAYRNDDNGSDAGQVRLYVSQTVGISSLSVNDISIYPNPTNGLINFDFADNHIKKLTVSDVTGKQIYTASNDQINQSNQVDLSNLENGIYVIVIQTDEGIFRSKIVKE